ncbi:MAG: type IV pilus assembly protein PilM [Myxococcales bacterium]
MSEGKNLIGVDIGSSSIKVCEIKEGRKGARSLVRFGYHPLPSQSIVDGHIMNSAAVIEGLDKLFHKQRRKDVALRISGHSVIIKKVTMPLMTAAELREQVAWEAEQHIPFDVSDVELDYQVLRRRQEEGQMDVLLVAAKKEEIQDLVNLASEAKLKAKVIDLDAFTVQNCFEAGYGAPVKGQTTVLMHVGASLTTINILADGNTAFTRDIANGGNAVTEEIQRQLSISQEEAEAYKCGSGGGIIPQEVPRIIQEVVLSLAGEIQRSLDFYLATSGDREIARVVMSGGSARLGALQEAISQRCRAPVEVIDPLKAAQLDGKSLGAPELDGRGPAAAVAFGLALRKDKERAAS